MEQPTAELSHIGRTVEWYEARHIQMARRIACYRRNIKSLQRAHDAESIRAQSALNSMRNSREHYLSEHNRLHKLLEEAKQQERRTAALPRALVWSVVALALSSVAMLGVVLWSSVR